MKTICFLNNKGGVGKTASVTTVAHMMASKFGKKVLVIDLDPQANTSNLYSDIDFIELFSEIMSKQKSRKNKSVEDLLMNKDEDIHECIKKTQYENLDIIPSFLTLSEVEELLKADITSPQQFRLKHHLKKIENEYDYCIIDCSPSISILNINALVASEDVYVSTRCDAGSCVGVAITHNLVDTVSDYNSNLNIAGIFFTQWNGKKNVSQAVYDLLEGVFKDKLLPITIANSKLIEESSIDQVPLLAYAKNKVDRESRVVKDYLNLTKYILSPNKGIFLKQLKERGK